ncbi:hypothetical protein P9126_09425 [Bacillus glycinifermentans]|uniref:hypothetical protein n=1 Tax=Bacillus glycinifermentans TaxID=1664069 RepID=UPI002DB92C05|nr:hypothetical protein [Bacillus glycinifermentans]MEC3607215.1 hypothetical protein [Bacillus glycinifermentans]
MKKTLFLWMFILLSLGLFLFYGFKVPPLNRHSPFHYSPKSRKRTNTRRGKKRSHTPTIPLKKKTVRARFI